MASRSQFASIFAFLSLLSLLSGVIANGTTSKLDGRSSQPPANLSLMCIGDSITVGVGDGLDNHNGYRLALYNLLKEAGISPQFMGNQSNGTNNPQPNHEGFGFNTISQIMKHMQLDNTMSFKPNLVLIHAGTNDNDMEIGNDTFVAAPDRLGTMVDLVIEHNPSAVLLVAKVIANTFNKTQTAYFNSRVPEIVEERIHQGHKVQLVDMSMIGGDELSDLLHPDAAGYTDMARRWFNAIMAVPDSWWTANATNITQLISSSSSITSSTILSSTLIPVSPSTTSTSTIAEASTTSPSKSTPTSSRGSILMPSKPFDMSIALIILFGLLAPFTICLAS